MKVQINRTFLMQRLSIKKFDFCAESLTMRSIALLALCLVQHLFDLVLMLTTHSDGPFVSCFQTGGGWQCQKGHTDIHAIANTNSQSICDSVALSYTFALCPTNPLALSSTIH
jgi:hypothetical protein